MVLVFNVSEEIEYLKGMADKLIDRYADSTNRFCCSQQGPSKYPVSQRTLGMYILVV